MQIYHTHGSKICTCKTIYVTLESLYEFVAGVKMLKLVILYRAPTMHSVVINNIISDVISAVINDVIQHVIIDPLCEVIISAWRGRE